MAGMDVKVGWAVFGIEDALILLDRAKEQNDGVVHEGESLACLPRAKDGAFVHLVLSFAKDSNGGPAPVGVRAAGVAHNDGLSFAGELSELVQIDALDKEGLIEGVDSGGGAMIGAREAFVKELAQELITGRDTVGRCGGPEAKTFLDGSDEEGGIVLRVVDGSDQRHGLSCEMIFFVDVGKLIRELASPNDLAIGGIMGRKVVGDQILKSFARIDGFDGSR